MKITEIKLGCVSRSAVYGESSPDFQLYLFRSPVLFENSGTNLSFKECSAVIFTDGKKQYFRPSGNKPLKYDRISFRMSAADKQYAASMDIDFDKPFEVKDAFIISSTLKNMRSYSIDRSRHKTEFMELAMRMILICLCSTAGHEIKRPEVPKYHQLKILRESIYEDPVRNWSIDEICSNLCISKTYFHRIYSEAFGITCRQDIIESRLGFAAGLLANTAMSISEIAEKCGYESDSYFMRQFKQHKGITPTEYRKKAAEESIQPVKMFKKS